MVCHKVCHNMEAKIHCIKHLLQNYMYFYQSLGNLAKIW